MTETLHRITSFVPIPREASAPAAAVDTSEAWDRLTPEQRRSSELEQLRIDLAAGR